MNAQLNHRRSTLKVLVVCVVSFVMTGCGQQYTDVSGTVSYRGRSVVTGTVSIIGSDQLTYYAPIQLDGTFTAKNVPVGSAKVGVYSPDPYFELPVPPEVKSRLEEARRASGVATIPKPPKGRWVRLPPKYADPLTSEVVAELTVPNSVLDLRLQ